MNILNPIPYAASRTVLLTLFIALSACTSPTEVAHRHYEQGMALFKKGGKDDLIKADREFRNALEIRKTLAPAIYGLALVAERQGKFVDMYSFLNQTLGQDPSNVEARIKLGKMLLDAGQLDRAAEAADKALAQKPNDLGAQALHAGVLLKKGDAATAVGLAKKILTQDPANTDAILLLANERLTAGDAVAALIYADSGLKTQVNNVALLAIRIQSLEKLNRIDDAVAAIRTLIAGHPENPAFPGALIRFLVAHGRKDAAEAELRSVAAQEPADATASLRLVQFVNSMRGPLAARQELTAMVARQPKNNELKLALASLLQSTKDESGAEALLRDIIAQAGDSADGLKAKGQLAGFLLNTGDKVGAKKLADEVLAKDDRNEQARILKAAMNLDERNLDQVVNDMRALVHDFPDSARGLVLLGKALEMQGAASLAEDQFVQAYHSSKLEPNFGLTYAEFLLRQNQPARAEKLISEIVGANPSLVPALKLLARARSDQGNWAGVQQVNGEIARLGG